ncbi:MAG: L-2-hydroxyglutarate oxidase [Gammaproteobacteria bacterium]|jgi:L-2-hydroxyglutarate oxidase LhgO|nr:L-2-hydroxyglutarate oxidase [Gammaproteobacteria bacterium]
MVTKAKRADFLVIGAGIIGINIAREIKRRNPGSSVVLLEKETVCGEHASGRNSGVLHAGFYYTADSLKARFTRDGNQALTEYCDDKGIFLNKCGKLVVASNESEDRLLDELLRRGATNGVALEELSAEEARRIEPRIKTYRRAIYSPTTSSADPLTVIQHMEQDARREGIDFRYGAGYVRRDGMKILTKSGDYVVGHLVNAAGLYADKVARDFGFSEDYAILPFKGIYLKSNEQKGAYKTHIYPVPDLEYPFLGVHFTITVDGITKIGPTAIPAFWRENYNGFNGFSLGEVVDIGLRSASLFTSSEFKFSRLAMTEIRKYSRNHLISLATKLATGVTESHFRDWGKPGIRAQLVNTKKRKLEMDFVLEGNSESTHVLNAVSPGWTCSIPFSAYVVDYIDRNLSTLT